MKVRELIEALSKVDPELDVVTSPTDTYGDTIKGLKIIEYAQKFNEPLDAYVHRFTPEGEAKRGFKVCRIEPSFDGYYLEPIPQDID